MWVRLPLSTTEIESVRALYAVLGFPGCIGSLECTHSGWARSPQLRLFLFEIQDPVVIDHGVFMCVFIQVGTITSTATDGMSTLTFPKPLF